VNGARDTSTGLRKKSSKSTGLGKKSGDTGLS